MEQNQQSYNKIAEYWSEYRDKSEIGELVPKLVAKLKPNGKILDIGCGTGFPIAAYLVEQGFEVTGIDFSEKLLQKAIDRNLSNTQFILTNFFDFRPKETYDGIIAYDSFFHFPKQKQRLIYERIANWMNPEAYLLFTHGHKEGEIEGEMFNENFYYSSLDKDEVFRLLADVGIEMVWHKEKYFEKDISRDLVIIARKIKHISK